MNCLDFRRQLGTEPSSTAAEFVRHRHECPRCAEAAVRATAFEAALKRALHVDAAPELAESILLAQATRQSRRRAYLRRGGLLALAAMLVLAVGVGMRIEAQPLPALAVDHLSHEAIALTSTRRVSDAAVRKAFAQLGVRLAQVPDGSITFVACCPIGRSHSVHLVVTEGGEQVTVLYLVDRSVAQREDFQRNGWYGRSVPSGAGTLVLLARDATAFDRVEDAWRAALHG